MNSLDTDNKIPFTYFWSSLITVMVKQSLTIINSASPGLANITTILMRGNPKPAGGGRRCVFPIVPREIVARDFVFWEAACAGDVTLG